MEILILIVGFLIAAVWLYKSSRKKAKLRAEAELVEQGGLHWMCFPFS